MLLAVAPAAHAQAVALVAAFARAPHGGGAMVVLRGEAPLPLPTVAADSAALTLTFLPAQGGPVVSAGRLVLGPWTEALPGAAAHASGDTLRLVFPLAHPGLRPAAVWRMADEGRVLALSLDVPAEAAPPAAQGDPVFYTLDEADRWTFDTVVLDAGHGGHDTGATANGIREKDVTLGIVRRLAPMIEAQGLRVVLTRSTDEFVALAERGRRANAARGKLFVSVHVNATATGAPARGTETYILGLHKSAAAEAVMRRENAVVRYEDDPSAYAAFSAADLAEMALTGSAFLRTSEHLADRVERAFRAQGRTSRGVRQAGFYVLWSASMPSVLVETGFVNDPREAAYLASERGQEEVARAIASAVQAVVTAER